MWMLQALWCSLHLANLVKHDLLKWNSCFFHTLLVAMVALASQSFVSLLQSVLPCIWTLCILGYRIMSHSFFNHPVVVKEGVDTVSGVGKPLRGTTLMNARSQITTMVNTSVTAGSLLLWAAVAIRPTCQCDEAETTPESFAYYIPARYGLDGPGIESR